MAKMNLATALMAGALAMAATTTYAKDETVYLDFNQAVQNAVNKGLIDGRVKFYLAGTRGGKVIQSGLVSNKKTNGFGKSAAESCEHALHSALIQFDKVAKERGATAVTNIVSYYKKNEYRSTTKYQCIKGKAIAAVTIKGDLAR